MADYFVDPDAGDDTTGDGSVGTPWKTVQKAATETVATGSINVKAGTDDVLAAALTFGFAVSHTAPVTIRGYTATQNDGGIGGISGDDSVAIISGGTLDGLRFIDMHLHSTGSATIIDCDNFCSFFNCELDNTTGSGILFDAACVVYGCHIHNIGAVGVQMGIYGAVINCYFQNGANDFTNAVATENATGQKNIDGNIFSLDGTSNAISISVGTSDNGLAVRHNSMFTSGTGDGIVMGSAAAGENIDISNNLIEGFTDGIDGSTSADAGTTIVGNAFFDCTNDTNGIGSIYLLDNESLGATPFLKSGADTFANRVTYFQPVDTGNVLSPYGGHAAAKGAIQILAAAAGGAARLVGGGLVHA